MKRLLEVEVEERRDPRRHQLTFRLTSLAAVPLGVAVDEPSCMCFKVATRIDNRLNGKWTTQESRPKLVSGGKMPSCGGAARARVPLVILAVASGDLASGDLASGDLASGD